MNKVFKQQTEPYIARVNDTLAQWLEPSTAMAPKLAEAMRYSVLNGGKRIRPVLCYAAFEAIRGTKKAVSAAELNTVATAVECIHAYSLIHDDLPAMDDDDLRRGKPTCHIEFDEATAVLAGDALQSLAFEKLSDLDDSALAIKLVKELSVASGFQGMVGGQMLDLLAEGQSASLSLPDLERVHRHKTGALICASVRMGALAACATDTQLNTLTEYAEAIGLAFQVQDDIIDVCSDTETLGKAQGADIAMGKSTYVSLLGLCSAQDKAELLIDTAKAALERASLNNGLLPLIAEYIIDRRH